jgi:hypothetical protein
MTTEVAAASINDEDIPCVLGAGRMLEDDKIIFHVKLGVGNYRKRDAMTLSLPLSIAAGNIGISRFHRTSYLHR